MRLARIDPPKIPLQTTIQVTTKSAKNTREERAAIPNRLRIVRRAEEVRFVSVYFVRQSLLLWSLCFFSVVSYFPFFRILTWIQY